MRISKGSAVRAVKRAVLHKALKLWRRGVHTTTPNRAARRGMVRSINLPTDFIKCNEVKRRREHAMILATRKKMLDKLGFAMNA